MYWEKRNPKIYLYLLDEYYYYYISRTNQKKGKANSLKNNLYIKKNFKQQIFIIITYA